MTIETPLIPDQTERNWAMLSHLTALLTVFVGLSTGGAGVVVTLLVPLVLYIYFSNRSRYVAFHALQATVFQALGGIAYLVATASAGGLIATVWAITGVLSVVLVGLLCLPFALVITFGGLMAMVGMPIWMFYLTLRAAYVTYQGQNYYYPVVGEFVARTMNLA